MKRIAAFAVTLLLAIAFYFVEYFFWYFVFLIGVRILSFSETLFWVLIVLEGGAALGVTATLVIYGGSLSVAVSQSVWKSKKGLRYKLVGWFLVVLNALFLLSMILVPDGVRGYKPLIVAAILTMLIYGISLLISGKAAVQDDGPPPTERERLEARLRELDEKEGRNNG